MNKKVIVISGPTATRKTHYSIEIAKKNGLPIVNFDSLVFYRELSIGTAKPTHHELAGLENYLIGEISIQDPLNAAKFAEKASHIIEQLHSQNKTPVLVGGSGFYLNALMEGPYQEDLEAKSDAKIPGVGKNSESEKNFKTEQIGQPDNLWNALAEIDPARAQELHPNDHYRITRAIQFFQKTGRKFSEEKKRHNERPSYWKEQGWEILHLYLDIPKDQHWPIIRERTDFMLKSGLIDEVASLRVQFPEIPKPMKSIGYLETLDFLNQNPESEQQTPDKTDALSELIYINTRRLAKAQRTWFNRIDGKTGLNPLTDNLQILNLVDEFLA